MLAWQTLQWCVAQGSAKLDVAGAIERAVMTPLAQSLRSEEAHWKSAESRAWVLGVFRSLLETLAWCPALVEVEAVGGVGGKVAEVGRALLEQATRE